MFMERVYILSLLRVLLLHSCILPLVLSSTNFTDQSGLLAFKSKINIDPTNTILGGNWTTETNFCNWIGVSCSRRRQRVTALDLSYMGLQGTISPYVGNLSFLVSLDLRNNSFHGFLPYEISGLHRLRILILQANQLEGNIPPRLQRCRKLEVISLAINKLGGGIPEELGTLPKLRELYLNFNNLAGSVPFTLFNISSLLLLDLSKNRISGSLPMNLCHHCPNIQRLQISYNQFSGQLPSTIYQCKELVVLSLSFNWFDGRIPKEIGSLKKLEILYLGDNNLTGTIPPTLGNMSRLESLDISNNNIQGIIPSDFGRVSNLKLLNLAFNNLTGTIPIELFNISSLRAISFAINALSGNLPSGIGFGLSNLEQFLMGMNQISGNIPTSISNLSNLVVLDFAYSLLIGPIPTSLGHLKSLQELILGGNQLTGEEGNPELGFLTALSNCRLLEMLALENNPLNGIIPETVGNFSSSLKEFRAPRCQLKGHIPSRIGYLKGLIVLHLRGNNLTGNIPSAIGGLKGLQRLYLHHNKIEGFIPEELCQLRQLGELSLQNNKISGSIPNCIGNLSRLQRLYISSNRLESSLPINLWDLENLLFLNVSFNSLSGNLPPNMRKLNVIQNIDLSWNHISGNIPSIIGAFESLNSLNLSRNIFQGSIPQSFGNLRGLDFIDLSYNNLSGKIPKSLETLLLLKYLNLSFNKLSGEIPTGGPFANFTTQSFMGNQALCGKAIFLVPPCTIHSTRESRTKQLLLLKYIVPAIASLVILVSLIFLLRKHHKNKAQIPTIIDLIPAHPMISYEELRRGTNNFCDGNLLGVGSFGSVYKGILSDETSVAVKVLNLQLEAAVKSFDAECKVLRTIRHRNLVKVISTCSNPELRALVLQYMSNGSLEKWLYSHNYCLELLQRVSIMADVALALEYLHHCQAEPVVHCDLKPSNILLDEDMVAHVGDFGIAKILVANKDATQTKTLGTLGYIAPEFGTEGKVSTRGDVYSYGIMLLEIITRRKPTDEMFSAELSLREWVNASIPDNIMEVVDGGLVSIEDGGNVNPAEGVLLSIMELGLECTKVLPEERLDIKNVLVKLSKIKLALLHNRNRVS